MATTLRYKHSAEDLEREFQALLLEGGGLTLRGFMRLAMAGHPFMLGGYLTPENIYMAEQACGVQYPAIEAGLKGFFQVLECLVPEKGAKRPRVEPFIPEWCADILATVASVFPALKPGEILQLPLVAVGHYILASHRKNGGTTRRPMDNSSVKEALEALK